MPDLSYPIDLVGSDVRLREFASEDTDEVLAILGDTRVTHWLSFDSRDRSDVDAMISATIDRARVQPRLEFYLAIEHHRDLVGFIRLGLSGVRAAKLGYAIGAGYWGRGYASQAADLMIDFAFDRLNLHRITAAIGPDNAASIRVVDKLGFTREGCLRDHVFTNGDWRDSVLYSLLAHEWKS